MNNQIKLYNLLKFDSDKCTRCKKCIYVCDKGGILLFNDMIELNKKYCFACRKCLGECKYNAIYYNIEEGILEGNNVAAIIPYNADKAFINKKYADIITYELGEKVKVVETAFEMDRQTSKKINEDINTPLVISDYSNINLFINIKYPKFVKYLSRVKNVYYISSYLYRLLNKNKNIKIAAYAVPFESKLYFEDIKIIDELCDIPFKTSHKYNLLDIINTYIHIGKFNNDQPIDILEVSNNKTITLSNGYIDVNILLINDMEYLSGIDYSKYDFIFVCKETLYRSNGNLLKDEELNKLYKTKLKQPGHTEPLLSRG